MATLSARYGTGLTIKMVVRNASMQFADVVAEAMDTFNATDIADYDTACTEIGNTGEYYATWPTWLAVGTYNVQFVPLAGGTIVESDMLNCFSASNYYWDGTNLVPDWAVKLAISASPITDSIEELTNAIEAIVAHADYGNAKLVRSTTPANTLTVDTNHEVTVPDTQKVDVDTIKTQALTCGAGVTFGVYVGSTAAASIHTAANVYTAFGTGGNLTTCATATGFATPTNITAGTITTVGTTTTNTDMRGTDGANTTVPDIAGTAPTLAEIEDSRPLVWDTSDEPYVTDLKLNGVTLANSDKWKLYATTREVGATPDTYFWLFSDSARTADVASGSRTGPGSITLSAESDSGITGTATVTEPPNSYDNDETFTLRPANRQADSKAAQVAIGTATAAVDTLTKASGDGDLAAVLGDTNELQTDWANGGRLDLLLDDVPNTAEFNARTLLAAAYFIVGDYTTPPTVGAIDAELTSSHGSGAWKTATSVAVSDKTGFKLAADGLALVTTWTVDVTGTVSGNAIAGDAMTLADSEDIYHANILYTINNVNSQDEFRVSWYKNGIPITSGITKPTIRVFSGATGSDLIATTTLTEAGSSGVYYLNSTTRLPLGEGYEMVITSVIGGSTRTWQQLKSRDN